MSSITTKPTTFLPFVFIHSITCFPLLRSWVSGVSPLTFNPLSTVLTRNSLRKGTLRHAVDSIISTETAVSSYYTRSIRYLNWFTQKPSTATLLPSETITSPRLMWLMLKQLFVQRNPFKTPSTSRKMTLKGFY
jgi:hypothetical protein